MKATKKVLFVCHGNVGRSQMAEAFYNYYSREKSAISAGTDPSTPNRYSALPKTIIDTMKKEGVSMKGQSVKLITKEHVDQATHIYILCKKAQCPTFLLKSDKISFWKVADPYKKDKDFLTKIKNQIKVLVKSIA